MAEEFPKRPQAPILVPGDGWVYNGHEMEQETARQLYIADDRQWLLKLAQRQRTYMEHAQTCPKRRHPFDKTIRCLCGMSDYIAEALV